MSIRYSKELRSMIDSCLKHHPRQRPSINAILRLPFIQARIENFLSETVRCECKVPHSRCKVAECCSLPSQVRAEEFSHTILHRGKVGAVPKAPAAPFPLAGGGAAGQEARKQLPLMVAGRPLPPQPQLHLPPKIKPPPAKKYQPSAANQEEK